jgi:hypothetical protein
MPRTKELAVTANSAIVPSSNSLVASAARHGVGFKNYLKIARGTEWHDAAWTFYDTVGEYRYACDWVGNMLSKAILYATHASGGKVSGLTTGPAFEAIDVLFGDADGRAEMLRLIGIHMSVTGDCWLVGYTTKRHGYEEDVWEVVASTRLKQAYDGAPYQINDEILDMDPKDVLVIRLWRPHPKNSDKSVSPSRAALPILAELVKLTEHVAAQVDSRLASAGILLVPSEMTFPTPPERKTADGKVVTRTANNAEDLMAVIQEVAATAIEDRGDASALVPIVITAPAEAIAAVKHLTFWTELDKSAIELRNEAIKRLALSMDMPPEVLQGVAEANHWSAWSVDESAIKAHTEPLLKIITTSIAKEYLRPLLMGENGQDVADIRNYSIKADTSEMRVRPNRAKEALELYDRHEISGETLRRENGFGEDDKMEKEEMILAFLRKAAGGSTTPEIVAAALREIGLVLPDLSGVSPESDTQEGRPAPSLRELPVRDIPDRERSERRREARERGDVPSAQPGNRTATLIAASEQAVVRALERAGNRLKNKVQAKTNVPAAMLYMSMQTKVGDYDYLLDDAWSTVPAIANRHDVPIQWLKSTLDTYCRGLMTNQTQHTYDGFTEFMNRNVEIFDMTYPAEVSA